jgi:cytochrome c
MLVSYKIEVKDVEDGFSGFDEITANQVFMKVSWISERKRLPAYEAKEKTNANLYRLIAMNGCANCHSFRQKLAGPSFEQLTKKYSAMKGSVTNLAGKIRNGSKGVWGDSQQMPAHPDITQQEAEALVNWIFKRSADNQFQFVPGIEGVIQLNPTGKPKGGFYVLTASYTDRGINGKDMKTGSQTILIPATN